MAYTLAEYKKQSQDPLKAGVVQTYLDNAPFLLFIGIENINGGALTYNVEDALPTAGFRSVGVAYTPADEGTIAQTTVALTIAGGKIEIDRALRKMYGDDRLATSIAMKTKALARALNEAFYKGDGTLGSFTGLQTRATNVIANGTAALSLSNLREAVVKTQGSNKVIFCSTEMYLHLSTAKNDASLGGQINITQDEFGLPVTYFAGVPVIRAGQDAAGAEILDFSEATSTTSMYVVSFDENGVVGIQNGGMEVYTPKTEAVDSQVDIEWLFNYILQDPKSVYRVSEITDVAVVA